jgi:rhodanese-related sulfurtransferase
VGDEFMNVVNSKPADKLILDVRTQTEAAMGMIDGAMNIPVDELQGRLVELPKDREIITHCRTGLRAEMAYSILRNGGYKARFLNDKVAVIEDNLYCCYK